MAIEQILQNLQNMLLAQQQLGQPGAVQPTLQPPAIPDLVTPQPLDKTASILAIIGDTLQNLGAARQGRAGGGLPTLEALRARRREEADRANQQALFRFGVEERRAAAGRREQFETAEREKGETAATSLAQMKQQHALALQQQDFTNAMAMQNDAQAAALEQIAARGKAKAEDGTPQSTLASVGLLGFLEGNPDRNRPSLRQRIEAGEPTEQIVEDFRLTLEALGVEPELIDAMELRIRSRIQVLRPTETPQPAPGRQPDPLGLGGAVGTIGGVGLSPFGVLDISRGQPRG